MKAKREQKKAEQIVIKLFSRNYARDLLYNMAFYLLKSKPKNNIANLHNDIDHGLIHTLIPFGKFY